MKRGTPRHRKISLAEYQAEKKHIERILATGRQITVDAGDGTAMRAYLPAKPLPGPGEWKRRIRSAYDILRGRATIIRWY